jgi:hypothetical protein
LRFLLFFLASVAGAVLLAMADILGDESVGRHGLGGWFIMVVRALRLGDSPC